MLVDCHRQQLLEHLNNKHVCLFSNIFFIFNLQHLTLPDQFILWLLVNSCPLKNIHTTKFKYLITSEIYQLVQTHIHLAIEACTFSLFILLKLFHNSFKYAQWSIFIVFNLGGVVQFVNLQILFIVPFILRTLYIAAICGVDD